MEVSPETGPLGPWGFLKDFLSASLGINCTEVVNSGKAEGRLGAPKFRLLGLAPLLMSCAASLSITALVCFSLYNKVSD